MSTTCHLLPLCLRKVIVISSRCESHGHDSKYQFEHTRVNGNTGFCFAAISKL